MSSDFDSLIEAVNSAYPGAVKERIEYRGETTLIIDKDRISGVCRHLKASFGFTFLADLTAVDYLEIRTPRTRSSITSTGSGLKSMKISD
jgi:NADH:ubiquinone oxidoreductase subunit C